MTKLIKISVTFALLSASASASAWWDVPFNNGVVNDWMNGFFGDAEFSFHMRGNVFGNGYGRGNNYYYDRPYYGYGPYAYGPYAYGRGVAPQAPLAPVEQSPQR